MFKGHQSDVRDYPRQKIVLKNRTVDMRIFMQEVDRRIAERNSTKCKAKKRNDDISCSRTASNT